MEDILFKGRRDLFTAGLEEYAERHTSKGPELVQRLERETAQLPSKVMLSDRCVERFLKILAATLRPALAVDVGTFTGHSALAIAEGLPDGSKVIVTSESTNMLHVISVPDHQLVANILVGSRPRAATFSWLRPIFVLRPRVPRRCAMWPDPPPCAGPSPVHRGNITPR